MTPPGDSSSPLRGLILDSLLPSIDAETTTASSLNATLSRWTGSYSDLAEADFVLHVRTNLNARMIRHLRRCVAIGRFGTGLDTVDTAAAARHGMAVVGVADYATHEVAQHAVALAFAVARGVSAFSETHPRDAWSQLAALPMFGIRGPVGIVGYGKIGQYASTLFHGLGLEVRVATRTDPSRIDVRLIHQELDGLLADCEVVSLHTALVPDTRHLMNRDRIGRMRADAILVNTGRGALVETEALVDALRTGSIRGAGLDVYEIGGAVDWWEVLKRIGTNVVLTPHIGWYSPESLTRLREEAVVRTIDAARRGTESFA